VRLAIPSPASSGVVWTVLNRCAGNIRGRASVRGLSAEIDPDAQSSFALQLYWFFSQFQLWIPVWIVYLTLEQGFSPDTSDPSGRAVPAGYRRLGGADGAFADRYGRSVSLGVGGICFGVAVLLFAFATSFPLLLVSFMTWSFAADVHDGADNAVPLRHAQGVEPLGRVRSTGRGRGQALIWAGVGVATLLGGPIASLTDTRVTIFAGAVTCMITAVIGFLISDPPRETAAAARIVVSEIDRSRVPRALAPTGDSGRSSFSPG